MAPARKWMTWAAVAALTCCLLWGLLWDPLADCASVLFHGWGSQTYLAAAEADGTVCAAGVDGEEFVLALGTTAGEAVEKRRVRLTAPAEECQLAALYPESQGGVFLGVYEEEDGREAANLTLYRQPAEGQVEKLLTVACQGETGAERRANTRFSGFSESGELVLFAQIGPDGVQGYAYDRDGSGLREGESWQGEGALSAAVLPSQGLAVGGDQRLVLEGEEAPRSVENQIITQLKQAGAGLFYIDSASLKVFYSDLAGTAIRQVLELGQGYSLEGLTSYGLTDQGEALVLLDGHRLLLDKGDGLQDLTGILYRSRAASGLLLAGGAAGVLLLATLLWYGLFGWRQGQAPLALRWGTVLAAVGAVVTLAWLQGMLWPGTQSRWEQRTQRELAGLSALAAGDSQPAAGLENGAAAMLPGSRPQYAVYQRQQGGWQVVQGMEPVGSDAQLSPGFEAAAAAQALEQGMAFGKQGSRYTLYWEQDGQVCALSVEQAPVLAQAKGEYAALALRVWAVAVLILALAILLLALVGHRMKRLTQAMETLAGGDTACRVRIRSGDELEGMAQSFNSMAQAMEQLKTGQMDLIHAYLRFVPERVLNLLGKRSIVEVDKNTFASKRMAVMMVWFAFPDRVYDNSTRALFDSINQVIERTASIASRQGGTVFNFAYNGYDVVLEGQEGQAVSTAVAIQQEVLALNEQRAQLGQPEVRLCIALDVGDVMMGVVGDGYQLEPTTISSSFSTVKGLIQVCGRVGASILCTENIIGGASGYGSRYMGKCLQGGTPIRVYEIFDGDPYSVRKVKANTRQAFSEGVFALYSRDFAQAKRIFLELVHHNPGDGGARYFLYLADRLAQHPDGEIRLDGPWT